METFEIRTASIDDLMPITEIYNWATLNTTTTFDTIAKSEAEQIQWFNDHSGSYCILVAENRKGILGWASLNKWSNRCAYSETAEVSLFVAEDFHGKGVGSALLNALIESGKKHGLHTILARIAEGGAASIHIHEKLGFESIGKMKEVGNKFERRLDVDLMQLMLKEAPSTNPTSSR